MVGTKCNVFIKCKDLNRTKKVQELIPKSDTNAGTLITHLSLKIQAYSLDTSKNGHTTSILKYSKTQPHTCVFVYWDEECQLCLFFLI